MQMCEKVNVYRRKEGVIMSYRVNLGCWGSIFAVPTDVVDKYLKIAGSAQLKVLLWILRHSGESFELETVAQQLNMGAFDVNDCLEFWISFNIISKNGNVIAPAVDQNTQKEKSIAADELKVTSNQDVAVQYPAAKTNDSVPSVTAQYPAAKINNSIPKKLPSEEIQKPNVEKKEEKIPISSPTVVARPLRPDPVYVAKRINEDKEIEFLLNEAQFILGRPVSPNENAGLIMLHDNDGLPCEVILMLLTFGVENQKGMKQIEAMGASWAKDGVLTLQSAEEKIRELENSKEAWHKVQSVLGLEFRKPTQKEQENSDRWINEWKFSEGMIKEAYDICVNAKGKYIPNYVNTVLGRWHSAGITTVEQVRAERAKSQQKSSATNIGESVRKSSFDIDDLKGLSMFND